MRAWPALRQRLATRNSKTMLMTRFDDIQRFRWLRPNAHLYVRPDAQRFMRPDAQRLLRPDWKRFVQPGFDLLTGPPLLEGKANFNPNQPRVPKDNPGGGRWTYEEGWRGANRPFRNAGRRLRIGHNQGPPLDEPPEIPRQRPPTTQDKNWFIKAVAHWLARAARLGTPTGIFLAALDAASWLDTDRAFIDSYLDPPKSLEELQEAALNPRLGYHRHHNVEKDAARKDGFSDELINSRDNMVLVPALKHIKITTWYQTKNERFGGLSPRAYLQGKSWDERRRVGHEALIEFGVLKR